MPRSANLVVAARAHSVRDRSVLEAIATVPRAEFVPPWLAAHAYDDEPLPIPTALLARLAAAVWSIERWPDIARTARSHLVRSGSKNARVVVGDGSRGLPRYAPYNAILVAAAFPHVPPPIVAQLGDRGRLVQPIGRGGGDEVVLFVKSGGVLERTRRVAGANFVRLYGEHGFVS